MKGQVTRSGRFRTRRVRLGAVVMVVLATVAVVGASASTAGLRKTPPSKKAALRREALRKEASLLVAQARKVGTLNFYTSADPNTAQRLADAFGKKYGIKVTFTRLTSGPIAARYDAEAQSGTFNADVVMIADAPFFAEALHNGWMLPMTSKNVPNIGLDPLERKFQFYGSVGIGVSRLDLFVSNTGLVSASDRPTTWKDLLNSRWKGKLLTDDPRTIPVVMGQWALLDQKLGDNFLRGIASQNVQWVPSLVTGVQEVAAGERDAAFGANQLHVAPLLATAPNAPIFETHLGGIDFGFVWNAGVSAKSPNPAAGRLFVNWLLSGQGQEIFNGPGNNSVLPQVKVSGSPPLSAKFITLSSDVSAQKKAHILSLLGLG